MKQTQVLPEMIYETKKQALFKNKLITLSHSNELNLKSFVKTLIRAIYVLNNEKDQYRPLNKLSNPGGLINLKHNIPTIIISDLHGRRDYLLNALFDLKINKATNLSLLLNNKLQIICLGDGMHSEQRGYDRWLNAFNEYKAGFKVSPNMDEEMVESFSLMQMVMLLKISCPENFHFLKGNHENIKNEAGYGNFPFAKYVFEGEMVKVYVRKKWGKELLDYYSVFEKSLPVFAVGKNFLISHAEPIKSFTKEEIINSEGNHKVIEGLTWTDNDAAKEGSVNSMLKSFFPYYDDEMLFYFGGHRQVSGKYKKRAKGRYIQVNNQTQMYLTLVPENRVFNPDEDIYNISDFSNTNNS